MVMNGESLIDSCLRPSDTESIYRKVVFLADNSLSSNQLVEQLETKFRMIKGMGGGGSKCHGAWLASGQDHDLYLLGSRRKGRGHGLAESSVLLVVCHIHTP